MMAESSNKPVPAVSTGSRSREEWLDGIKGFAILLVILGHVLSGYLDARMFGSAFWSIYRVRTWIYSFHMPLFFLLSGFTFTLAYWQEGQLRRQRYFRQLFSIAWMYIVFALLQWCVKALVPGLVNETYSLEDLKNLLVVPLGNFWYLYVLFIFYVIAGLTGMPRRSPLWALFFGGLAITVLGDHLNWYHLTLYRVLYHFPFFMMGSLLCRYRAVLKGHRLYGISLMFLSNATLYFFCNHPRTWYSNWSFMIALTSSYALIWAFYRLPRLAAFPVFRICGKYSLELYLLHTFFTAGLRSMLTWAGITVPWVHAIINFILSTLVCLLIAVLAEKIPGAALLFRPGRLYDRAAGRLRDRRSAGKQTDGEACPPEADSE